MIFLIVIMLSSPLSSFDRRRPRIGGAAVPHPSKRANSVVQTVACQGSGCCFIPCR
jgi:hypothetical protein